MNTKNHLLAEKLWNETNSSRQAWIAAGIELHGIFAASIEQIEAHLNLVDEVAAGFDFSLDASKFEIGATREEIVAAAESKKQHYNRRAGVRALETKYGHEAAARIVKNHSGRNIR